MTDRRDFIFQGLLATGCLIVNPLKGLALKNNFGNTSNTLQIINSANGKAAESFLNNCVEETVAFAMPQKIKSPTPNKKVSLCQLGLNIAPTEGALFVTENAMPSQIYNKGSIKVGVINGGNIKTSMADALKAIDDTAQLLKENHDCNLVIFIVPEASKSLTVNYKATEELASATYYVDVMICQQECKKGHAFKTIRNANKAEVLILKQTAEDSNLKYLSLQFDDRKVRTGVILKPINV